MRQLNKTYQTITRILQNRKKLTDEMNIRFITAKPLQNHTFALLTNQQQVEGKSKKTFAIKNRAIPNNRKTNRYDLHIARSEKRKNHNSKKTFSTVLHKRKHIKEELHFYLLNVHIPTLKQPEKVIKNSEMKKGRNDHGKKELLPQPEKLYNILKRNVTLKLKTPLSPYRVYPLYT